MHVFNIIIGIVLYQQKGKTWELMYYRGTIESLDTTAKSNEVCQGKKDNKTKVWKVRIWNSTHFSEVTS